MGTRPACMRRRPASFLVASLLACLHAGASAHEEVRLVLDTDAGRIEAVLDTANAPRSACNVMRYAAGGHYDGGVFFRTVRSSQEAPGRAPIDVVQLEANAGEEFDAFGPVPLERTRDTGLSHRAGALSLARWGPDTATSSFSIVVRDSPPMDYGGARAADGQGFAVFGRVVAGMDVVEAIHATPARDERLLRPVRIRRAFLSGDPGLAAGVGEACGASTDR